MDSTTYQIRLDHWTQIVQNCTSSGLTRKEWCDQNQIPIKTYYYWQRRVRRHALALPASADDNTGFTELTVPAGNDSLDEQSLREACFHPDVVIRNGSLTIEISNTASKQLLSCLGKVISHA